MNIYIATSDKTSWILEHFAFLANKYLKCFDEIYVLGYSKFPELPERYKLVSLAPEQLSIDDWSKNLFDYFSTVKDEYILFGLDDFLITRPVNYQLLDDVFTYMKENNCHRYELGIGHSWHKHIETKGVIYEYGQDSLYRISTQFSIWERKYFLKYLSGRTNPFDFEIEGSRLAANDGNKIIATHYPVAFENVLGGAISARHLGKINVLGMNRDDVEEMIEKGLFDRDSLQLGMEIGENPKYI